MDENNSKMDKIDFVLLWVDDNDPEWQESYKHYSKIEFGESQEVRFRDWGTLKYWFRGVECFTPWVNRIFFVTCGHYPQWLNINHPKLKFVKHSDYIPKKYLPTFNSHTIELNLHRIKELGDNFVYFNDDTFIINHIQPERFFKEGKLREIAVLNAPQPSGDTMDHILCNDIAFANKFFNKKTIIRNNFTRWFCLKYRGNLLRTLALLKYPGFTGFIDPHLPNPFYKDTLTNVWNMYAEKLDQTCKCRFRNIGNVNQYIFRYYQLLKGDFKPINPFLTSITYSAIDDNSLLNAISDLKTQKKPLICINDGVVSDFEKSKVLLLEAFDSILPDKSSFEL